MFDQPSKIIFFLFAILMIAAEPCLSQVNIGFEKGNFDNWEFAVGKIETNGSITTYPSIAVPGSFTLFKNDLSGLTDPIGKFSVFSPNGSKYSMKLGNDFYGNGVQQISYTLKVPPTGSNNIIFDYAVVLQSPGHLPYQQPRFTVKVYNVTDGKYMDCPAFDFISSSKLPGFKLVNDSVYYKDWSSAAINLTNLHNKEIRLEFRVNHCPFGAHSGYAYIDVNENITTPIQGNRYCTNQTAITLSAPPGFATYSWFTADFKKLMGSGQYLSLPPPPDSTRLAVIVTAYNGLGCADTLYTVINGVKRDFRFVAKQTIVGCPGAAVDLTDKEIISGSDPDLTFEYLTDSLQLLPSPFQITQAGLYYIRATSLGGCSNLLPVKIAFEFPQLKITNPPAVRYPATVDLSKSFTAQQGVSYSYYKDERATTPITTFAAVQTSGKYYIKAESAYKCVNIQSVIVTVLPPKPYSITVPNTFTPNNDGINDRFAISLNGYVSFGSLHIYNRNGALLFNAGNASQFWDGTFRGQPVPTGTYYWVFEGIETYDHKKVNRSSFITLIR